MADGDVRYRFHADASGAERALAQMEARLDSYENKLKQVSRTSRKGSEDQIGLLQRTVSQLGSMTAGLIGVDAVVGQMGANWQKLASDIQAAIDKNAQFDRQVAAGTVEMGMAGRGLALKQFAENIPGVLPEQALAAFEGVQSGQPQAGFGEQSRIARAVAAMAPVLSAPDAAGNIDTSKLKDFGETASTLEQFFTDLPTNDLLDLTTALQGSVGGANIAKLRSGGFERAIDAMMQRGLTAEQSLATASVGIDAGLPAKSLLQEKVLATLDQGRIDALSQQFQQAMQGDLATQALLDVRQVNPAALALQRAAAQGRQALGPLSADLMNQQVMQQSARESMGPAGRMLLDTATGPNMLMIGGTIASSLGMGGAQQSVNAAAEQQLQRMTELMSETLQVQKQLLQQGQQNRPPIQRNAQSE